MFLKTTADREKERLKIIGNIFYFAIAFILFISYFRINIFVMKLGIGGPLPVPVSVFLFLLVIFIFIKYFFASYFFAVKEEKLPMTPKEGLLRPFVDAFHLFKKDIVISFLFSRWIITGKDYK